MRAPRLGHLFLLSVALVSGGLTGTGAPTTGAGPAAQAGPPGRPDAGAIERDLHAGRFGTAILSIRRQLDLGMGTKSGAGGLSVVELAALAALLTESATPIERLGDQRFELADASAYWYARGLVAARTAWPGGRAEPLKAAREAADHLDALTTVQGRLSRVEVRRISVLAAVAGAQEEREELALLLAHATRIDTQLRGAGAPDDRLMPLDELAGDLWLQLHRFDDARRSYQKAVSQQPTRTRAWYGLARAAWEAGAAFEARHAAARVLEAWADAPGLSAAKEEMRALVEPVPRP